MNYYENPIQAYQGLLTNSSATLYTSPAAVTGDSALRPRSAMLTEVLIANTDTAVCTLTLYIVPSGGSIGAASTVVPTSDIEANSFVRLTFATVMPAGSTLRGLGGTTNKICLTVTVVERIPLTP